MKKKKRIKILCDELSRQVARNIVLLKENDELGNENERLKEANNYMNSAGAVAKLIEENAKLEQQLKSSKALASELGKENAHLRTENDLARMQMQDAQNRMRTPVFVPIK